MSAAHKLALIDAIAELRERISDSHREGSRERQECQSARKRDPLSASKRDPFRGAVSAEAARRNDCLEFSEVEVADRLPACGVVRAQLGLACRPYRARPGSLAEPARHSAGERGKSPLTSTWAASVAGGSPFSENVKSRRRPSSVRS